MRELIARDSYGKLDFDVIKDNKPSDRDLLVLEVNPLHEFQAGIVIEILGERDNIWQKLYSFQDPNAWQIGSLGHRFKGKRPTVCLEYFGTRTILPYKDGWRRDPALFAGKPGKSFPLLSHPILIPRTFLHA